MKKLLLSVFLILCLSVPATAADTITQSWSDATYAGHECKVVTFVFNADNPASNPSAATLTASYQDYLAANNFYLWLVRTIGNTGGTEPTTNSDVYLYETVSRDVDGDGTAEDYTFDLLGGAGVDALDNDANNEIVPLVGTVEVFRPIPEAVSLSVAGNGVANSDFAILLYFRKMP